MVTRIEHVRIRNYRSLADVSLDIGPVGVLFGPNGSGKSTFLDTLWFVRDCAIRGVEPASASRSHGVGILFDQAEDNDQRIAIDIRTDRVRYELGFDLSSGRINSSPGEHLVSLSTGRDLIRREAGSDRAHLYHHAVSQAADIQLREPEKLTLSSYLNFNPADDEAGSLDRLLHFVRLYHSRSFYLHRLKTRGSDSGPEVRLRDRGDNAWSVLRNLHDRRQVDDRFNVITQFMSKAFPTFDTLVLEQTGPTSVYARFLENGHTREVLASGVSDGHLQMLLLLTALFSEGSRETVVLLDEPEISLHPWALAVLGEAIRTASYEWNKQVLVATHSPVLISQFEPHEIIATETEDGRTRVRPVSEIEGVGELLENYAAGSLYMSQAIGAQEPGLAAGGTSRE
jgi:predicted ATPase